MRLTLALILTFLCACADLKPNKATDRTGSLSTEERKALSHQAREAARLSRERYIATTRPALQLKFRQEYPAMTEADIELLINDALEKGLHQEAGRRREEPLMRPLNNCMASPLEKSQLPELLLVSLYGSSQSPAIRVHAG